MPHLASSPFQGAGTVQSKERNKEEMKRKARQAINAELQKVVKELEKLKGGNSA